MLKIRLEFYLLCPAVIFLEINLSKTKKGWKNWLNSITL